MATIKRETRIFFHCFNILFPNNRVLVNDIYDTHMMKLRPRIETMYFILKKKKHLSDNKAINMIQKNRLRGLQMLNAAGKSLKEVLLLFN